MTDLRPVRGTHDLLGEDLRRHRHVAATAEAIARLYGYEEIRTPIMEFVEVFQRTLGDTSDVVMKEMYAFEDRGGERLTLRPENTAAVLRAIMSGGLAQNLPLRFFYHGPMFRYERPQKGRLRQFHQIGIELVGAPEPMADVEVIATGAHILDALGIGDRVVLHINSLGDVEARAAYRDKLVAYLQGHRDRLSEDSLVRLERNPLRILDSRDPTDREIVASAPLMQDSLNEASLDHLARVQEGLTRLGVAYVMDPLLVRGLDYYTHTAFEFVTTDLGTQGTVMAGGRYDGLMAHMGGPSIPGVGWAAGVERLSMLIEPPPPPERPVALIPIGEKAEAEASTLAAQLRRAGVPVDLAFRGKPGQRMKRANRINARLALSLGDDELAAGTVKLRDLDSGTEETLPLAGLVGRLTGKG